MDDIFFDCKVEEFYRSEVVYCIDWFFAEILEIGVNGPVRAKIPDYPSFPRWLTQAFGVLYRELQKEARNSVSNKA